MNDIKFGTDGWRAIIADDYTLANVRRVAEATALWLKEQNKNPSCVIGFDCRFGGEMFANETALILGEHGIKTFLSKIFISTPMVSLGAFKLNATAGIVITASHNPPTYNGFKIKAGYGGPALPVEIEKIESLIPSERISPSVTIPELVDSRLIEYIDFEEMYMETVKASFDMNMLQNPSTTIAYDAMYGAGQRIVPQILPQSESIHCDYNPGFNGTAPEPIHKNLLELSALIKKRGSFAGGLANDGDADRIGMYDENGKFVDAHHIILILIHYLHKYKNLTGEVVVAFSTTQKIKKLCELYNLPYTLTKVGFKYICGYMVKNDVLVGGEESGGIAVKGHIPERDGIWDGLLILEYMARTGKKLSELIQEVYELVGSFCYDRQDLHVDNAIKNSIIEKCLNTNFDSIGEFKVIEKQTLDGVKFLFENDAWLMFRASGTEPLLRVYAEGKDEQEMNSIFKAVYNTFPELK